jgi:hypothetical protein
LKEKGRDRKQDKSVRKGDFGRRRERGSEVMRRDIKEDREKRKTECLRSETEIE